MKRLKTILLVIGVLIAAAVVGNIAVNVIRHAGHAAHEQALYYCPMHPAYTSNRSGSCPVCNMSLVKRESVSPEESSVKGLRDICYLHNCPMVKKGQVCPMLVVAKEGEKVSCPVCGTHVVAEASPGDSKILYWTDPMMPGYRSDRPGKSPMGMDLIPVYETDAGMQASAQATPPDGYAPILISSQKKQLIGVKTAPAQVREIAKTIRTVGRIAYDPELYQAQEEYLQALKALERARQGSVPEIIEQAERLAASSRTRLRLLGLSQTLIDEVVQRGRPDVRLLLSDTDQEVWLYAPIYEFELPLVEVGQRVVVEVPAMPGTTLEGTVRSIDPVLDPATRSARIRAVLSNEEGLLKPEMFVNASIAVTVGEVLAVPEEAVFNTGAKQIIFVDKGEGVMEPRNVTVGTKAGGYYEIKEGLTEGESVVTSGNFLIDSESRLKSALEGMGGEHQHGQ